MSLSLSLPLSLSLSLSLSLTDKLFGKRLLQAGRHIMSHKSWMKSVPTENCDLLMTFAGKYPTCKHTRPSERDSQSRRTNENAEEDADIDHNHLHSYAVRERVDRLSAMALYLLPLQCCCYCKCRIWFQRCCCCELDKVPVLLWIRCSSCAGSPGVCGGTINTTCREKGSFDAAGGDCNVWWLKRNLLVNWLQSGYMRAIRDKMCFFCGYLYMYMYVYIYTYIYDSVRYIKYDNDYLWWNGR